MTDLDLEELKRRAAAAKPGYVLRIDGAELTALIAEVERLRARVIVLDKELEAQGIMEP